MYGFLVPMRNRKIWNESPEEKERLAWWINDRFGLFIHWGPTLWPLVMNG